MQFRKDECESSFMKSLQAGPLHLEFVSRFDLVLHEETDPPRVWRLVESLAADGLLRHPPVVGRSADGTNIVLDGATRTTALGTLNAVHIPVQVFPYPSRSVSVASWYHLVPSNAVAGVLEIMGKFPFASIQEYPEVESLALMSNPDTLMVLRESGRSIVVETVSGTSLCERTSLLRDAVRSYRLTSEVFRLACTELKELTEGLNRGLVAVLFPEMTSSLVIETVASGCYLPAGITRHSISGRLLNINIPLDLITAGSDLQEKNHWLQSMISEAVRNKRVRYYTEPVFVIED